MGMYGLRVLRFRNRIAKQVWVIFDSVASAADGPVGLLPAAVLLLGAEQVLATRPVPVVLAEPAGADLESGALEAVQVVVVPLARPTPEWGSPRR